MSDKQTAAMLDKKLDEKTAHTMFVCGIVMVIAVLIHDGDLARTADVAGEIRALTLEEILRADVGIKRGVQFQGTRVPTLREFCEYVSAENDTMQFNFEFKDYFRHGEEWAKASADKIIAMTMVITHGVK